ncbi:MAG TPA: hypothetical protein VLE69_03070 [Candidatus Saccharimonadales bacterium]|nr:hypothetical protein [Candidatus Saccharimonadales bacterium]
MKKVTNTSGFAVLEIVLVIVIVGILGFVGWYVYQAKNKTNKTFESTANSQGEPTKASNKTAQPTQTASALKYLTIKEWEVRIPLDTLDSGAYYEIDKDVQQPSANPTNLTVYASEIDDLTGPAGNSCKGEYVAYLLRLKKDDSKWQPSTSIDDGNVSPLFSERKDIGDYKYAITTKKQYGPDCFATSKTGDYVVDQTTSQKFDSVVTTFMNDFKSIEKN